jgi:hypothetical protein
MWGYDPHEMKKALKLCKRIVSKIRAFLERGDEDLKKVDKIRNSCADLECLWWLLRLEINRNVTYIYSDSDSEQEMSDGPLEDVMLKLVSFSEKYKSEETFTPSILSDLMDVKECCEKMLHECILARK